MQQEVSYRSRAAGTPPAPSSACPHRASVHVSLGVGLYAVAFVTSATTMTAKDESNLESATARSYFTDLLGQIDAASSRGDHVAVLDTNVPDGVVASAFLPGISSLYTLPVVAPDVAIDQLRD